MFAFKPKLPGSRQAHAFTTCKKMGSRLLERLDSKFEA